MNQRRGRRTKRAHQPEQAPPRRRRDSRPANRVLVALVSLAGFAALFCLFVMGFALHQIWRLSEHVDMVRSLPDASQSALGEASILDGRIAASEPARYKDFVAYVRKRERGGTKSSARYEQVIDQATPAFAVEAGPHTYRLINDDYRFERIEDTWADTRRVDEGPTTLSGAVTIEGLVVRSPVMVVGRLVPADGGGPSFRAESVVGLSRADYVARLGASQDSLWKLVPLLALLTPLLIWFAWRGGRRVMRSD